MGSSRMQIGDREIEAELLGYVLYSRESMLKKSRNQAPNSSNVVKSLNCKDNAEEVPKLDRRQRVSSGAV